MLNIIYGRESTDKEKYIFDHISGKSLLIVPDQFTLEAERMAFDRMGVSGMMDFEIADFAGLSQRVLKETGRDPRVHIDKYGRHMLLSLVMEKVRDRLEIYGAYAGSASFIAMVNDFLARIRQNDVTVSGLKEIRDKIPAGSLLGKKLADICAIYEVYEEILGDKYIDPEMQTDSLAAGIAGSAYVREREIWIASFDSFTAKNMDIIEALSRSAREVRLVLCHDRGGRDSDLFRLSGAIIEELKSRVGEIYVQQISGYERKLSPAIAAVEKELFALPVKPHSDHSGIRIVQASDVYSQVESAAAYVASLVSDEGLRYRDIALVCNSIEDNQAMIRRIFDMYGIPLFIDKKRRVMASSVVTFVLLSLDTVISGFNTERMMRLYKCGIWDLDEEDIADLENYCFCFKIDGRAWEKDFRRGAGKMEAEALEKINAVRRKAVGSLLDLRAAVSGAGTMHGCVTALYDYLAADCGIRERIDGEASLLSGCGHLDEGEILRQIWNILCDLLDQIDEIMGERKCSPADLADMLRAGLRDMETGIIPQNYDSVSVGTCQRSRLGDVKAVVVLCADEGILPSAAGGNDLFSADELSVFAAEDIHLLSRDRLRRAEENMGVYRTFSRPQRYLWIGCSGQDRLGNEVKPSPVIDSLKRIFPELREEEDIFAAGKADALISSLRSTEEHAVRALSGMLRGEEPDEKWRQVIGYIGKEDPGRLRLIERGLFYSPVEMEKDRDRYLQVLKKGRDDLIVSPSSLEKYARCPFLHFVDYALAPEERRVFEMGDREIGDVYHIVFKRLADELTAPGKKITGGDSPWMTVDKEGYERLMGRIVDEETVSYNGGVLIADPAGGYRTSRLKEIISEAGWILIGHARSGRIDETLTEERFGKGRRIPPLAIEAGGQQVYIEGIIDRLDILPGGSVKIIDYKTGKETFSVREAEAGLKLQLMIYLMAGMNCDGKKRKPAGVFYFKIKDSVENRKKAGDELDPEALLADFRMDGMMVEDPQVIRSIAGDFTAASQTTKLKRLRNGEFDSRSQASMPADEFDALIGTVKERIAAICADISEGRIAPSPVRMKSGFTACSYCGYKSICGFDISFEGCRYRTI